ncbi:MAG: LuxR family transcriptional regulator [Chloroflexi bacterium]|nr:LuxR family transcriptional regulator [Chloroflexota bacterium]
MLGTRPTSRRRLYDRRSERGALDRLLGAVHEGRSGVLVLRGEAGIGKTALLDYAVETASGCRVARVTGVESEAELSFAGLHRLCREMLHRLDHLPGPQRHALSSALGLTPGAQPDRFLVGLAVLSLLADVAEEQPLLCVVEDGHWLDQASAQVLAIAARRLHAESVAVLVAIREPCAAPQFEGLPELRVPGLPDRDARELLASVTPGGLDARVRDGIVAETHGNPLALLELPRGLQPAELAAGFGLPGTLPPVPDRIEQTFTRRVEQLPAATRLLLLLAAVEPTGQAQLLRRAAARLGIGVDAVAPAVADGLVEFGVRVAFRHPLVRSAVYGAASPDQRRTVHSALADAIDPIHDPERRAWHRANAAAGPDEAVADELERAAARARGRGGLVAAATLLERAAALTPDPARRAERLLTAADSQLEAGSHGAASRLLDGADVGRLDELQHARLERMRAWIAFVTRRGRDAPSLLVSAARRLEPLDVRLARETYFEALEAAIAAAYYGSGPVLLEVAEAVRAAPPAQEPAQASDPVLDGLARLWSQGYVAGVPPLKRALGACLHSDDLRTLHSAVRAARELWDHEAWLTLATRWVQVARHTGALTLLPLALNHMTGATLMTGDLDAGAALIEEARSITTATGSPYISYAEVYLAALRGVEPTYDRIAEEMLEDAEARGEGYAITAIEYSTAILHNSLGKYGTALAAAQRACAPGTVSRALPELIEAAARSGRPELAGPFLEQLSELAHCTGAELALGARACSHALMVEGREAEDLFREALDRLSRTRARLHLARAHLLYGEWLRGGRRRLDAREQLRTAHEMFVPMGAKAFADRAARELLATGERAPKPTVGSGGRLTAQEMQIARLAHEGLSNQEIGARLFLSPRTVEYHLHKVFKKLGVGSRTDLGNVLPGVVGNTGQTAPRRP